MNAVVFGHAWKRLPARGHADRERGAPDRDADLGPAEVVADDPGQAQPGDRGRDHQPEADVLEQRGLGVDPDLLDRGEQRAARHQPAEQRPPQPAAGRRQLLARLGQRPDRVADRADGRDQERHPDPLRDVPDQRPDRRGALEPVEGGELEPGQVVRPGQVRRPEQQRDGGRAERGRVDQRPAAEPGRGREPGQADHARHEQQRRVLGGDRQREHRGGQQVERAGVVRQPHHQPGRQREEEQRGGVVGGQVAEEQGRLGRRVQDGRAQADPLVEQPPAHRVDQAGHRQHLEQAERPRGGQPADAVGQRAEHRVEHRRAGEVGRVVALQRRAVQEVPDLEVADVQVEALVLERRVGHPQRQQRLQDHDERQHAAADPDSPGRGRPQPGGPVTARGRRARPAVVQPDEPVLGGGVGQHRLQRREHHGVGLGPLDLGRLGQLPLLGHLLLLGSLIRSG